MTRIFTLFLVMLTSVLSLYAQDCAEKPFTYVVLGSSTAFGNGAVPIADSSFVNIFRKSVKAKNNASEVYNIAIGATNTYHANPTWYLPPANRPVPNTAMNITRAINEFKPDGIIISFPSNDAAERYTLDEQKANFERIVSVADSFNVPVWVTSTQPRNESLAIRQDLVTMRDWLATRFGSRYIDCWTDLAAADGMIATAYSYGDGIHLNNKGHRIIAERVMAKDMESVMCDDVHKLRNFRAGAINNVPYLQWRSEGERFLAYYVIQSSINGTAWDSVGTVNAYGVLNTPHDYEFKDTVPLLTNKSFRLKLVDVHGRATYSAVASLTATVPVDLAYFNGSVSGDSLNLSWATGREAGLSHFVIEHQTNGRWDSVTMVNATGNSSSLKTYNKALKYTLVQPYTYRIAMKDKAGVAYYSAVVTIKPSVLDLQPFRLDTLFVNNDNGNITVNWQTSAEYKTLEYRLLSHTASAGWSLERTVPAAGISNSIKKFGVAVGQLKQDTYFMLEMVDSLGRKFNSNEVIFRYGQPSFEMGNISVVFDHELRKVEWNTLSESKLRNFIVQRSTTDLTTWINLANIAPKGNANSYSFVDSSSPRFQPQSYYRLAIEDSTGRIRYSQVASITIDTAKLNPYVLEYFTVYHHPTFREVWVTWATSWKGYDPLYFYPQRSIDNGLTWDSVITKPAGIYNTGSGLESYRIVDEMMFDMDVKYRLAVSNKANNMFYSYETVLPRLTGTVNLASFTGYGDFGTSVLNWQTSNENKASKMILRRSTDQKQWDIVTGLRAAGNSTIPQDYGYIDRRVPQTILYYRVEMEDSLGRHINSWPIAVTPDTMYAQPYRMGTFTGRADANKQILHWETTAEKNTARFIVDRSNDSTSWSYGIDTLAAAGTGAHLNGKKYDVTYTYNISTTTNKVYYRLRLQDTLARNFTVAAVTIAADTNFANPFRLASIAATRGLNRQTITWSTAKEWSSKNFRIERYIGTSGWLPVDSVAAAGMSSTLKNYTYTDTGYSEKDINYRIVMNDQYGRSFISPNVLLPVDTNYTQFYRLGTFTARRDGIKQTISWQTTKEWNTVKFVIERNNDTAWVKIDSVAAAGMAMQGKSYTYTDTAYSPKETYYRLVVRDTYNRTERSPEAFVRVDSNYVTPYRIAAYSAKRELDKQVVTWTTTKEWQLKNFLVERNNGKGWMRVDSLAATNVFAGSVYTYTDKEYSGVETYYRIEVRDNYGRATRQGEVFVRVDSNYITPIRLAAFTAARNNSNRVLNWVTSKEFRSKQFKLERKNTAGAWDSVYAVAGAGVAMGGKTYNFTDTAFLPDALTYRLVMNDLSGQVFNSAEVKVIADTNYITPFRFSAFTVKQDKDKQVISWTSVKEWNISSYDIERHVLPATGGREMEEGWEVIANVKATGAESGEKVYTYTDTQTQEKQVAYRIVALDKFGRDFSTPSVSLTPNLGYKNAFNLTAFSVTRQNGKRVLQWRTDSENGSLRFVIDRSTDSLNWSKLDSINAAGTSAVAKDYSFTDGDNTTTVWVYYRLRMIDAKGNVTVSKVEKILALITALPGAPILPDGKVIVYPNPAAKEIKIAGHTGNVYTEIFNAQGQRVYVNPQYNGSEINVDVWPSGMYFIILEKGKYRMSLIKL